MTSAFLFGYWYPNTFARQVRIMLSYTRAACAGVSSGCSYRQSRPVKKKLVMRET